MRMNDFSTNTTFHFELRQVFKDNFLARSVTGRRARNGAAGRSLRVEASVARRTRVPVNRLRCDAKHLPRISTVLRWQIFTFIQAKGEVPILKRLCLLDF
ncbi:hypothetical protein ACMFMG_011781 [Clarireedia jacksonii]